MGNNFTTIQRDAYEAIAAAPVFEPDAATTVFEDFGDKKNQIEAALDIDNKGVGYAITVWPPAKGQATSQDASGLNGVNNTIVVRFEINPKIFTALVENTNDEDIQDAGGGDIEQVLQIPDAGEWVACRMDAIFDAVLGVPATPGGVKFQLSPDAYELMSFNDEGSITYHLRFIRFSAIGC